MMEKDVKLEKKEDKHYLTGKEIRAIAKANHKQMKELEKAKNKNEDLQFPKYYLDLSFHVEGAINHMWTISALQMHEHGIIVSVPS